MSTLSYNGYTFEPDMCWFRIRRIGILGNTNRLNFVRDYWDINGSCNGLSAAEVDAKVVAITDAVRDGGDLVFSLGSTMRLLSSECASGTHVRSFEWLSGYDGVRGSGAEGILRRTFRMTIFGDKVQTSDTDITDYSESINSIGSGGARIIPVGSLAGGVQAQQVNAYTPFFMIQSGFSTGLTDYPEPPLPAYYLIPGVFYFPESLSVTRVSPRSWGINQNTGFTTRWSYRCWSSSNLIGNPGSF